MQLVSGTAFLCNWIQGLNPLCRLLCDSFALSGPLFLVDAFLTLLAVMALGSPPLGLSLCTGFFWLLTQKKEFPALSGPLLFSTEFILPNLRPGGVFSFAMKHALHLFQIYIYIYILPKVMNRLTSLLLYLQIPDFT